jgi:2-keto-4-pentenoate hydratase
MTGIDPWLRQALERQLESRRAALERGARHIGWKLGVGERERVGDGPVIGYLTTATELAPGAAYRAGGAQLHADAEIALELARDVLPGATAAAVRGAIGGFGTALELVDLGGEERGAAVVAANVFHRAFALGPLDRSLPADVEGRLIVAGRPRAAAPAEADIPALVSAVANLLGAVGEQLRAGDRLITGSVVQVPVAVGEEVTADLGPLGRVRLTIGS